MFNQAVVYKPKREVVEKLEAMKSDASKDALLLADPIESAAAKYAAKQIDAYISFIWQSACDDVPLTYEDLMILGYMKETDKC